MKSKNQPLPVPLIAPGHFPRLRLPHLLLITALASIGLAVMGCQSTDPVVRATGYVRSGMDHEKQGDLAAAMEDYSRALALVPQAALVYESRGHVQKELGNLDQAIADCSEAIRLAPRYPFGYTTRGECYEEKEDYQAALADYTVALQLNPNDWLRYVDRSVMRRELGDFDGAIADGTQAIALKPREVLSYWVRGKARFEQGDHTGALADFTSAIELDRGHKGGYEARAVLWFRKGDFAAALKDFEEALRISPNESLTPSFHSYLIRLRLGLPVDRPALARAVKRWDRGWPKPVGDYLTGVISEEELLRLAQQGDAKTVRDHSCDAFYYTGAMRLVNGDLAGARQRFTRCVATGLRMSIGYSFAKAELARLEKELPPSHGSYAQR